MEFTSSLFSKSMKEEKTISNYKINYDFDLSIET